MPSQDRNEKLTYLNDSWNLNKSKRSKIDKVRYKYHTDEDYKEQALFHSKKHYEFNKEKIKTQAKHRYYWIKSFGDYRYTWNSWNLLRIGGDVFL